MITRKDTPYIAHPVLAWTMVLGGLWSLVNLMMVATASWLQFAVGMSIGLAFGAVGSYGIVRMLTFFASKAQEEPKMKWYAFLWLLWGLSGIMAFILFAAAYFAGGSAASALVSRLAHLISPRHFADLLPAKELLPGVPMSYCQPTLPIFNTAFGIALWGRILLWYYRNPK